jgi:hypothetical protein
MLCVEQLLLPERVLHAVTQSSDCAALRLLHLKFNEVQLEPAAGGDAHGGGVVKLQCINRRLDCLTARLYGLLPLMGNTCARCVLLSCGFWLLLHAGHAPATPRFACTSHLPQLWHSMRLLCEHDTSASVTLLSSAESLPVTYVRCGVTTPTPQPTPRRVSTQTIDNFHTITGSQLFCSLVLKNVASNFDGFALVLAAMPESFAMS